MKKHGIGTKLLAALLALAMILPVMPLQAFAAVGDKQNGNTGLQGDIDTTDTIKLPIKIYDYLNDGMLFEYAENNVSGTASYRPANWKDYKPTVALGSDFTSGNTNEGMYKFYNGSGYGKTKYISGNDFGTHLFLDLSGKSDRTPKVITDFGEDTMKPKDSVRYLVLVYRGYNYANNSQTIQFYFNADKSTGGGVDGSYATKNFSINMSHDEWKAGVFDLKTGNLGSHWGSINSVAGVYAYWPNDRGTDYNNKGVDVIYAAYFSNQLDAEIFAKQATNYVGTTYQMNSKDDNRGFGLLRSSRNTHYTDTIGESNGFSDDGGKYPSIVQINTHGTSVGAKDLDDYGTSLGYPLHGVFGDEGIATLGLLERDLQNGLPVYKEKAVDYVAQLLQKSLTIPLINSADNYRNYSYVGGTASDRYDGLDLATWLRKNINGMGSYNDSKNKKLVGTWDECKGNIKTYYDAAYFLLNSIFVSGSYNTPMSDYNYLVLSKGTATDGRETYIFDAGFSDSANAASAKSSVQYDTANGIIRNTSAAGKTEFCYQGESWTTFYPFLPIVDGSGNNTNGATKTPYFLDPGVQETNTNLGNYVNRNFNFALVSDGEFVYHEEDNLFFDFEGDDDVYLFINNKLVLDIGGAHSISKETIELNDYKTDLGLKDGEVYSFKFFYLERHGYGANMRINTNIRVTDPKMTTEKTAYQSGSQVEYGGVVDKTLPVEYGFAMTNNGNVNLYNLTFTDNTIGIKLDPTNGLTATGSQICDVNGGTLEVTDLTAYVDGYDQKTGAKLDTITVTFANETELKNFLTSLTSGSVVESGGGLWPKSTVTIRGFAYRLTEDQIQAGVFDNVVDTTATPGMNGTPLTGQDQMRVFVPSDPMYYQWAGNDLSITKEKFIADVLAAANQQGNVLAGKVPGLTADNVTSITEVLSNGNTTDYANVSISDSDKHLTVNYPTPGSYLFRVKITYNTDQSVVVPVLVNVADVKDSVFVLDYGLTAELTQDNELFKDDSLNVPGRDNTHSMLGVGNTQPSYTPNNISFAAASGNTLDGLYGTYTLTDGTSLKYKPTEFMEGLDTMWLAVDVREKDAAASAIGNVNINKEVQMYKSVTVLPATVVYYEDDFPAITYETVEGNTITPLGSSSGKTQSVDQSEQYGHDAAYADGSNTDKSGGSLHTIAINEKGVVASFGFKGTGFELIARTNAADSATISVEVYQGETLVKRIPVITEFDNGADGGEEEIYQVPIIRVDDLALGQYTVKISGAPARDYSKEDKPVVTTYLYLDGLRIFQPMGATNENYSKEENGATFAEIRDLIVNGTVAAAQLNGDEVTVSTGTVTWTENLNDTTYQEGVIEGNQVNSVDDYLIKGPNNEVYMNGDTTDSALVFYVKKTTGDVHNLQIAVHAVDVGLFTGAGSKGMSAALQVGIAKNGTYAWTPLVTVTSATEQYYTIDLTDCPVDNQGRIQVAVRVDSGMASFTSLKYNGVTIESIGGDATTLYYENGILKEKETGNEANAASYANFASVSKQMRATAVVQSVDDIDDAVSTEPEEPGTEEPGTEEPGTEEPGTEEPGTEEPGTEEPGTEEPGTEEPDTEEPGTEEPGTEEPGTEEPGTEEPGTEEPGTEEPGTEEPGTEEPGTEEPGTEEPGTEEPGTEEPGTEEPGAEDPGTSGGNNSISRLQMIEILLKFFKRIWG